MEASCVTPVAATRGAARASWRDYVTLTKPRIMSLLLLTAFCGMCAAAQGLPPVSRALAAMAGLGLACGGASALNHFLDRDIDALMGERTRCRPLPSARVEPAAALHFGLALSAASFVLLASAVNLLTALLALAGNLFYVCVYTGYLKRRTVQNIVVGGAAGAVPPLVGWAAVSGHVGVAAVYLFLLVFLWTPPHFWALALLLRDQYAAAGIPMLPVVRGTQETTRQILAYSLVLVAATLGGVVWFGWIAFGAAAALGALLLWLALALRRDPSRRRAQVLFHYSLAYLALLFAAVAVGAAV